MQQINQILQLSQAQHDLLKFDLFLAWCDQRALNFTHLQSLLCNQKIWHWFCTQYQIQEAKFLNDIQQYKHLNTKDLIAVYDTYTTRIEYYPKALLNQVKKQIKAPNTLSYQYN